MDPEQREAGDESEQGSPTFDCEEQDAALPHLIMMFAIVFVSLLGIFQLAIIGSSVHEKRNTVARDLPNKLLEHLPPETLAAIEDPSSAQAKALTWIKHDTKASLPLKRILQRYSMATLYYALGGAHWRSRTYWLDYDVHECGWFHTVCEDDVLTRLDLHNNNLSGSAPFELGLLTSLEFLDVSKNPQLIGAVPPTICEDVQAEFLEIKADCSLIHCC